MFQPPQQSGSYDTEAEVKRRTERLAYPSIWLELWHMTLLLFRLPVKVWRAVRRK